MNRTEILNTAREYVTDTREAEHGDAEAVFRTIAGYWSTHLGTDVTPIDVAVMMGLLKAARIKANPGNPDGWTDLVGYAAIGGELALGGEKAGKEGAVETRITAADLRIWRSCPKCGSARTLAFSVKSGRTECRCRDCNWEWDVPL